MEDGIINNLVTKFAQAIINTTLIALLLLLGFLMLRQTYSIGLYAIYDSKNVHLILEQMLNFFLYFAFFSMIIIYYKNGGHFPLRYLIYIGITATVRYIIVNRTDAMQNLLLSIVILLLILGYILLASNKWLPNYLMDKRRNHYEQKGTSI
jgi:protein PsiE